MEKQLPWGQPTSSSLAAPSTETPTEAESLLNNYLPDDASNFL